MWFMQRILCAVHASLEERCHYQEWRLSDDVAMMGWTRIRVKVIEVTPMVSLEKD